MLASAMASAVVTALLVRATAPHLAVAMVVVLGATLAGIFPPSSASPAPASPPTPARSSAPLHDGPHRRDDAPWVTGQAAAAWGLRPALGLVVLQFLAVAALQWLVTAGRARPASAGSR